MASSSGVLVLLLLAVVLPCVVGTALVVNPVVPTEGDEYLMECTGSGDLHYFLLHQKGDALPPDFYEKLEIHVFENASVYFMNVSVEHEGTHLCIRSSDNAKYQGFPTSLRVRPLPPDDLWGEVYETKFVTGFLAALVIGALFVLGCLVHRYRWRPKEIEDADPILSKSAYVNPAMTPDETESTSSTNM